MPRQSVPSALENDPIILAVATWFACGIVLLGLTPLPLHTAALGWSPAFWLVAAPAVLLVARHMTAPRGLGMWVRHEAHRVGRGDVPAIRRRRPRGMAHARPGQRTAA